MALLTRPESTRRLTVPEPDYTQGASWGNGQPDPEALAAARALQALWPDYRLVVFGSRATGTWRPGSDLDLAVIGVEAGGRETDDRLRAQALKHLEAQDLACPWLQINAFTESDFDNLKASLPHLAGQVQLRGIQTNGEPMPPVPQNNPWPGVRVRLQNTRKHLEYALGALGVDQSEMAVRSAHTALENILKAALGYLGVENVVDAEGQVVGVEKTHDLEALAGGMPGTHVDWLAGLPAVDLQKRLTRFRRLGDYSGDVPEWNDAEAVEIVADAQFGCGRLAGLLLDTLGKTPRETGYANWLEAGSLAGWEVAPLDYFEPDVVGTRDLAAARAAGEAEGEIRGAERGEERGIGIGHDQGRAAGFVEGRRAAHLEAALHLIPVLLETALSAADRHALAAHWRARGAPADYLERLQQVRDAPAQWRRLCDCPDDADGRDSPAGDSPAGSGML